MKKNKNTQEIIFNCISCNSGYKTISINLSGIKNIENCSNCSNFYTGNYKEKILGRSERFYRLMEAYEKKSNKNNKK